MKVILSDKARGDLLRIDKHLADRNEAAADALAAKFNTSFSNLARFPFLGRPRIGLGAGVRCLVVGRHLVFYVVDQDRLTIIRVIDGRMDVEEEFKR